MIARPGPVAWVLNLDADLELAAGKAYAPSRAVLAAMDAPRARLAELLLGEGDVLLGEGDVLATAAPETPGRIAGAKPATMGRAFCPTPRALARMARAGVTPEPHPSFEVLRAVNGRAFSAGLGQTLPGASFLTRVDDALAVLAGPPPVGRQWRAKRAFGMAGRGQRPIAAGAASEADVAFLRASIEREGGLQIEPEVEIVRELAVHGLVAEDGRLRLGRLVLQECDAAGQWLASRAAGEESPALQAEAERVGRALHGAGYFGPFGIDAFEYRSGEGEVRLNLRSEINARYSMGFPASGLGPT